MKQVFVALVGLCLIATGANAWWKSIQQAGVGGAPPAFTGAGDVVGSAAAFWGLQAYTSATRGNKVANICTTIATIDTCLDMSSDATTGLLVLGTIGGLACNNTTQICNVKILYDQSGGLNCSSAACDASQATVATRPTLLISGIGSLASLQCSGAQILVSPTPTTIAQPVTVSGVANANGGSTGAPWYGDANEFIETGRHSTTEGFIAAGATAFIAGVNDNATYSIQAVFNGASSIYAFGGASGTGSSTVNPGTNQAQSAHNICGNNNGGDRHFTGLVGEVGIWPIAFSGTQNTNMITNQRSSGRWNF